MRVQYKIAGAWQEAPTVDLQSIQRYELTLLRRKPSEPEDRFRGLLYLRTSLLALLFTFAFSYSQTSPLWQCCVWQRMRSTGPCLSSSVTEGLANRERVICHGIETLENLGFLDLQAEICVEAAKLLGLFTAQQRRGRNWHTPLQFRALCGYGTGARPS